MLLCLSTQSTAKVRQNTRTDQWMRDERYREANGNSGLTIVPVLGRTSGVVQLP